MSHNEDVHGNENHPCRGNEQVGCSQYGGDESYIGVPDDERPKNCAWCLCEHIGEHHHDDPEHGEEGHTGFRCVQCAMESGYYDVNDVWVPTTVLIESSSGDAWQTKQIVWQEACDVVFRKFDDDTADHFPVHEPRGCTTCPEKPDLPPKPVKPIDRVDSQLGRKFMAGSDQDYDDQP